MIQPIKFNRGLCIINHSDGYLKDLVITENVILPTIVSPTSAAIDPVNQNVTFQFYPAGMSLKNCRSLFE